MSKDEALKLALDALDEFCELGAIIRPLEVRDALQKALAEPTSADYAMGYAEGFNDACKPAQQEKIPLSEKEFLEAEIKRLEHNEEVLMNALFKACGDDAQVVNDTIESQGELK